MTTCDSLPPGSRLHLQENVRFNSRLFKAKIYLKRNHWLLDLFDVVAKFSKPIISLMTLLPKISGKGRGLRKKSWNKRNFAILEVINCCVSSHLNAIELTCHGVRPKFKYLSMEGHNNKKIFIGIKLIQAINFIMKINAGQRRIKICIKWAGCSWTFLDCIELLWKKSSV